MNNLIVAFPEPSCDDISDDELDRLIKELADIFEETLSQEAEQRKLKQKEQRQKKIEEDYNKAMQGI